MNIIENMKRNLFSVLICSSLVACGGGGGDSPSADIQTDDEIGSQQETAVQLRADRDFEFESSRILRIDIQLSSVLDGEAVLSICEHPEQADLDDEIDYTRCMVTGVIKDGSYKGKIRLPNHIDTIITELRPLRDLNERYSYVWKAVDGRDFIIR